MIVSAFSKRLRKNPPPDEDILAALVWVERMVSAVRGESDISELPSADIDTLADDDTVSDEDEFTRPETDVLV